MHKQCLEVQEQKYQPTMAITKAKIMEERRAEISTCSVVTEYVGAERRFMQSYLGSIDVKDSEWGTKSLSSNQVRSISHDIQLYLTSFL